MINKELVGQKIFALRKKKGITQDHLAKLVSVTPQAISKWEKGAALPDTFILPVLSEIFNVDVEEILCVSKQKHSVLEDDGKDRVLLHGLEYFPGSPSLVSCIRSGLDYLNIHVSQGWISAPYAFMLNINDEVSYKGPDYWNDNGCFDELVRNCGGVIENYGGHKEDADISDKRRTAWNMIRDSINKGLPCYAWELDEPQYYLIKGYDDIGYYYIDPDTMQIKGPKPYDELGNSDWGILEIHIIRQGSISDSLKTLKDVFEYAVNVGNPKIHAPNDGYTMGTKAYQVWWEAIANKKADYDGVVYNASFWAKCKSLAVLFLQEGKLRTGTMEQLYDSAISCYEDAAKSLNRLSAVFSLTKEGNVINSDQRKEAVKLLQATQKSETEGITVINSILNEIYKIW